MSHYIEKVTVSLENLISELARNPSLFLKNPDTDFSRNRKINFKTCVGITMNSGGCTLNKELLDFFDFDVNAPTVSAYTQQRAKILPEAFMVKMNIVYIMYWTTIVIQLTVFTNVKQKMAISNHLSNY